MDEWLECNTKKTGEGERGETETEMNGVGRGGVVAFTADDFQRRME